MSDQTSNEQIDYDALAARLTDPDYPVRSAGHVKTGAAAAAEGRAFLLREYGSMEAIEAEMHAGRPRLGDTKRGPSPAIRGRVTEADHAAFKRLEQGTGRGQSDLVREAVHDLLVKHAATSTAGK